jgi:hypothetical protein
VVRADFADIDHWDCFDTAAEAEEASGSEETGECIIHGESLKELRMPL